MTTFAADTPLRKFGANQAEDDSPPNHNIESSDWTGPAKSDTVNTCASLAMDLLLRAASLDLSNGHT